jgi:hypothetical protein
MAGWSKIAKKSSISFFNYEAKMTVHLERCQTKIEKKIIETWEGKKGTLKHTKTFQSKMCSKFPQVHQKKSVACFHKFYLCLLNLKFCMAQTEDTNMIKH